ncbi:calmodulin-like [Glandiceps talaboti]
MADQLTEEQITEFKGIFASFDKGSGLPAKDLGEALKKAGQASTDGEVADIIKNAGCGEDGCVNLDKFYSILAQLLSESEIREAFRMFDKEGKGIISVAQLRTVIKDLGEKLTEDEVEEMIRDADIDGDGQVNYEEFVTLMTS